MCLDGTRTTSDSNQDVVTLSVSREPPLNYEGALETGRTSHAQSYLNPPHPIAGQRRGS
jgi:hypothetical protein